MAHLLARRRGLCAVHCAVTHLNSANIVEYTGGSHSTDSAALACRGVAVLAGADVALSGTISACLIQPRMRGRRPWTPHVNALAGIGGMGMSQNVSPMMLKNGTAFPTSF